MEISAFQFSPHAHFSELILTDIHPYRLSWIIDKVGHFLGFLVMDFLLYRLFRREFNAAVVAVLFAISTEVFQLYVSRDGRLYDIAIDSFGVLVSYLVQRLML